MGTYHSTIYVGTSQWVHVTVQVHTRDSNYKMDTSQWIHVTLTVQYVNAANYKHICHSIAKTVTLCVHQQTINVDINVCHSIVKTVTLCKYSCEYCKLSNVYTLL